MKSGPNKRTKGEIKDQLLDAHRAYRESKEKLVENSITYVESRRSNLFAPLFVGLMLASWTAVVLWEPPIGAIFDLSGFLVIFVVFYISYLAFFHVSKLIFRPSNEEAADDTAYFALFSACPARERRGLFSAGFGIANTVAFVMCVIVKQTGLHAWRLL